MKAPQAFETARLLLRRPAERDVEEIYRRYACDPDVTRFLSWPRHHSIADTQAFIAFSTQEWDRWPAGPYLIWSRGDGRLLGGTGLSFEDSESAITGYVLTKDAWGRGFATEALAAMVEVARGIGVRRISAQCHHAHHASRRVLEKGGFTCNDARTLRVDFPNLTPGEPQIAVVYELYLA